MIFQINIFELFDQPDFRQWILVVFLISAFALLSWYTRVGVGREAGFAAFRAVVQILLLASVIMVIFESKDAILVTLALIVMVIFGAMTAGRRAGMAGAFVSSLAAIGVSSFAVLGITVAGGGLSTEAIILIPLGGMLVGNCMNVCSLAINRLAGDVKSNYTLVEAAIALGCNNAQALQPYRIQSIRSSLIPVLDNLKTLGVVWIPGLMAGLLLAGEPPFDAARLQLLLFSMIILASLISSLLSTKLLEDAVLIKSMTEMMKNE